MKKTIIFSLVIGMMAVFSVPAEAAFADATVDTVDQTWQRQQPRINRSRNNNRNRWDRRDRDRGRSRMNDRRYGNYRVRYETLTVRRGNKIYRETYRIYWDDGRMKRKRVDRVRIR